MLLGCVMMLTSAMLWLCYIELASAAGQFATPNWNPHYFSTQCVELIVWHLSGAEGADVDNAATECHRAEDHQSVITTHYSHPLDTGNCCCSCAGLHSWLNSSDNLSSENWVKLSQLSPGMWCCLVSRSSHLQWRRKDYNQTDGLVSIDSSSPYK